MNTTRKAMALFVMLCLGLGAQAQFDNDYGVEDWTLDFEEEEAPKPKHKEYKNTLYLQYSPSRYLTSESSRSSFNEFALGYSRNIQVIEDKPYFVEAGANMKFAWSKDNLDARALSFRIPINVLYKFYLCKDKDYAIAPYAGASARAIAWARNYSEAKSVNLMGGDGWSAFQVAWQAGVRFYFNRYLLGVSYSRDFHDSSKYPGIRECGVHIGYSF